MTQDRLFKLQVRRLAKLNGLSYTEAKKQLRIILNNDLAPILRPPEPSIPQVLDNGLLSLGVGFAKDPELDNFIKQKHSVLWRPSVEPHIHVEGFTGSGKTVLSHAITDALQDTWVLLPIDPRGVEWDQGASTLAEALKVIDYAIDTINRRNARLMRENRNAIDSGGSDGKRMLLILDEFRNFDPDDSRFDECVAKLSTILLQGRAAGVHILESAQSGSVFSHAFRLNFALDITMLSKFDAEDQGLEAARGLALLKRYGVEDAVFQVASRKTLNVD